MSMFSSVTGDTLIADMIMTRAGGWHGEFVLMEGPTDARFAKIFLKVKTLAAVITHGVDNLISCMSKPLPSELDGRLIAIADRDFCEYLETNPFAKCGNILFYDEGFLETFLVSAGALEKVISLHAQESKIDEFERASGRSIFENLEVICTFFAKLRILNSQNSWGLSFEKDFTPYRYVNQTTWLLDNERLSADFSRAAGLTKSDLDALLGRICPKSPMSLMHGHDAVKILDIGLSRCLGRKQVGPDSLAMELCIAAEAAMIEKKQMYAQFRKWQEDRPTRVK